MPSTRVGAVSIIPTPGVAYTAGPNEIIYVSDTRLSESLSQPAHHDCPTAEPSVGSEE
jgi:hypothetical protein